MVARLALFLVLVVALIAVSIFGVSMLHQSNAPAPQAAGLPTQQVLVASSVLQAGSLLQPGDIADGTVPVGALPDGASLDTPANRSGLIGAMVRNPISSGAPILADQVIHPGDHGFLSAVLAPGMVATTVGVDAISGAAGLIWPGDHVDLLLTQTLDNPELPLGQRIAAELVLRDIRVIATGQQLTQGSTGADGRVAPPAASTVTLEVTPDQAARTAVASKLGPLSLVVHSAESTPVSEQDEAAAAHANAPVWADQVSPALSSVRAAPPVQPQVHVTVIGAGGDQDYKF
jgi:pilus assembly protein CpaB